MEGPPSKSGLWQEAKNAEGRSYYYNAQTKVTQWEKPSELMTPQERALADQPWKEYTAEGGRKYWYNAETKQSSWEMPQVYKEAIAPSLPATVPPTPTFVAGGGSLSLQQQHPPERRERADFPSRDRFDRNNRPPFNDSMSAVSPMVKTDPEFSNFEEAEATFLKLLKRVNISPDAVWEDAMRSVIRDPQYRVLRDPRDRKLAFDKYAIEVRAQEKERAKERLAKLREDFGKMLRSHPEIKHYTRWKSARPMLQGETIFRSTADDVERRQLFGEYLVELKKAHTEQELKDRKRALEDLNDLLKSLSLEPYTRWIDARGIIQSHERFKADDHFRTLTQSDILAAFGNHVKSLERDLNDIRQRDKSSKVRTERQARDRYIQLLEEQKAAGKINAGSRWADVLPIIEADDRYVALLGQPGSTPLDLFWDLIEEEEKNLRIPRSEVQNVLEDKRYVVSAATTIEEFLDVIRADRRTASIDRASLSVIFSRLHAKAVRRSEEDKSQAERQKRRAIDALRSRIKHLEPAIHYQDTWDEVRPRVESLPEYTALDSDDARHAAFEKVIRRLKEKAEDVHRRRADREKYDQREREGSGRNGHHHRPSRPYKDDHSGRLSRSPEPNAYEADRRRAQADRERQHRKHSPGPSVGRGSRGWDGEMEWERDRGPSRQVSHHHDRERRDREVERERSYKPRDARDSLEYDDRPNRRRARQGSHASEESLRSSKRARRERSPPPKLRRDQSPVIAPTKEEPVEYKSGSEEGEIEEG